MSKFERIINTFKNGLVTPRLRGAVVSAEDGSSAEQLDNFIIDRTGAAIRRKGMMVVATSEAVSTSGQDPYVYRTSLLGEEYVFTFSDSLSYYTPPIIQGALEGAYMNGQNASIPCKTFGVQDPRYALFSASVTSWAYTGTTITLTVVSGHGVFVGDFFYVTGLTSTTNPPNGGLFVATARTATTITYEAPAIPTGATGVSSARAYMIADDMSMWNGRQASAGINPSSSGLQEYLLNTQLSIINVEKISDRTILVMCEGGGFPYYISLLDYSDGTKTVRGFFKYPLFVSNILLLQNLGKTNSDAVKCPIVPSNYPFNAVNTDPALAINATRFTSTEGAATAAGVLAKSNEGFIWQVTLPISITKVNGRNIGLGGRFINIPSADQTKDVVFFLTNEDSTTSTTVTYRAIQVIGGAIGASSTAWKLSSWGEENYPRSGNMCFGRLVLANSGFSPSQWWASAIHPDNRQYFQGMMTEPLKQDLSSDTSGMGYGGVALNTITTPTTKTAIADIYRFGFNDFAPSYGAIQWVTSRRRIHLGTSKGECQITFGNGAYTAASYEQNQIGTTESDLGKFATGNRRIFYTAAGTIRSISTDDKDYESVDTLLTSTIQGLDVRWKRIEWTEETSTLLCQTDTGRLFFLSLDNDTQVKAFSELITSKLVSSFHGRTILFKNKPNSDGSTDTIRYSCLFQPAVFNAFEYDPQQVMNFGESVSTYDFFGDFYTVSQPYDFYIDSVFTFHLNSDVSIYFNGVVYPFTVGATPPTFDDLPMPDKALMLEGVPMFVYREANKARLKSLPVFEGGKFGTSVGDIQRVDRITVLIDQSGPFRYGSELDKMIDSEGVTSPMTKVVAIEFPASPDREQFIYIESDDLSPLNISGVSLRGVSYSGE